MNLLNAKKHSVYIIKEVSTSDGGLKTRFFHLGFTPGNSLTLKRKAPLFGDPLLYEVGDSQIALTKNEAKLIEVEKLEA